ncbi:SGNH/GDSL hydrolase family protein [Neobacillus niacini]|uniref:SGNH/GDSL hydrolase family protein n=1 Tax=Neobacillus niacini TaxID=86668 RepID=UPI001C8D4009|nr:SGNH/GDSL hydrolase family protein [Neobacillus niacini]MBY0145132.1 SGNH/GDSL hydrolase family protein [Neobacillus niacini]
MKYFLTAVWGLVCLGVLAYGHIHWNQQVAVKAVEPVTTQQITETDFSSYLEMAANWPDTAKDQLKLALESGQPFKILFVGSSSMEWEKSVTQSISESFGSDKIVTALHTYDQTSADFIGENKQLELVAEKAQLVVLEPFLFNDNGKLKIEETLANVTKMIEDIRAQNPDTTFILQPSNPIYLPQYYSEQIEGLKNFAAANNLTYLDHWIAWPATDNPELENYLNEDQSPNELGYQAWAHFLSAYFVKNKED